MHYTIPSLLALVSTLSAPVASTIMARQNKKVPTIKIIQIWANGAQGARDIPGSNHVERSIPGGCLRGLTFEEVGGKFLLTSAIKSDSGERISSPEGEAEGAWKPDAGPSFSYVLYGHGPFRFEGIPDGTEPPSWDFSTESNDGGDPAGPCRGEIGGVRLTCESDKPLQCSKD